MEVNKQNRVNLQYAKNVIEEIWKVLNDFKQEVESAQYTQIEQEVPSLPIEDIQEPDFQFNESAPTTPIGVPQSSITLDEDKFEASPEQYLQTTPQFDSIASRRTPREHSKPVYYKEPSLRGTITPGDPFTYSIETGIIKQTRPISRTRLGSKSRSSSSRKFH